MKYLNVTSLLILCLLGCMMYPSTAQENGTAQKVVDKAIKVQGGKNVEKGAFTFGFRKHTYSYERNKGQYRYTRTHKENGIKDVLTNDGLERFDSGKEVSLSKKDHDAYGNSVNSVIYFAFIPYFLNDAAVNKEYLGEETIKGMDYHKIRVTFEQNGGGKDFDDVYVYWIDKKDHSLDYLAYSFHVNGGGVRFREAYNTRKIGGVVFQDYVNYKHEKETPVESLGALFDKGELKELSKIILENVRVMDSSI